MNLDSQGHYEFTISINLDDDCDISIFGSSSISIIGDNPNSSLNISVNGNSILNKLRANVSGSGFHVLRMLKGSNSGSGNINLTHDTKCVVNKHVSGIGKINTIIQ